MNEVFLISKPLGPPWNDSSKNLARDLAVSLKRHQPIAFGRLRTDFHLPTGRMLPVPGRKPRSFALGPLDRTVILGRLLSDRRASLHHYFFAPNPNSSRIASFVQRMRSVPTVQTVCSAPREDLDPTGLLFADRTVVLSRMTEQRLIAAGVSAERLVRIPPAIAPVDPISNGESREIRGWLNVSDNALLLVYPGDLEFGSGAERVLDAFGALDNADTHLAMAYRLKTTKALHAEAELKVKAARMGLSGRVTWVGETGRIHSLVGAADLVVLPTETLYAKMDYPLVLLEAMSMERAVVVSRGTPAEELAHDGAARACDPSVEALRDELARLIASREERNLLGQKGREAVLTRYGRQDMAAAYEALYDQLLGGGA